MKKRTSKKSIGATQRTRRRSAGAEDGRTAAASIRAPRKCGCVWGWTFATQFPAERVWCPFRGRLLRWRGGRWGSRPTLTAPDRLPGPPVTTLIHRRDRWVRTNAGPFSGERRRAPQWRPFWPVHWKIRYDNGCRSGAPRRSSPLLSASAPAAAGNSNNDTLRHSEIGNLWFIRIKVRKGERNQAASTVELK